MMISLIWAGAGAEDFFSSLMSCSSDSSLSLSYDVEELNDGKMGTADVSAWQRSNDELNSVASDRLLRLANCTGAADEKFDTSAAEAGFATGTGLGECFARSNDLILAPSFFFFLHFSAFSLPLFFSGAAD